MTTSLLSQTLNLLTTTTTTKITATSLLALTLTALVIPIAYKDYKTYLSYGPGGVPHNVFGWLAVTLVVGPLKREMLSTGMYEEKIRMGETESFLFEEDLGERKGERPVMGSHALPQRQMSQVPGEEVKGNLLEKFNNFITKNQHLVQVSSSHLERHSPAMFVADNIPKPQVARNMSGEIAHIHTTSEFSVHVVLAPADCKKVIEAGWSQRHPLSGSPILKAICAGKTPYLPPEYVFIYAPRDDEEIEIAMKIIVAGVKYMTGSREIKY